MSKKTQLCATKGEKILISKGKYDKIRLNKEKLREVIL